MLHRQLGGICRYRQLRVVERDQRHLAVAAVVIDGGVVRDPVNPGGEGDTLVLEEVEASEAAGHGVDGQILRVLGPAEAGIDVVIDTVEISLIKDAGRVLIAFSDAFNELAVVVRRRLSQFAHWVTLWAVLGTRDEGRSMTSSRMITL